MAEINSLTCIATRSKRKKGRTWDMISLNIISFKKETPIVKPIHQCR